MQRYQKISGENEFIFQSSYSICLNLINTFFLFSHDTYFFKWAATNLTTLSCSTSFNVTERI